MDVYSDIQFASLCCYLSKLGRVMLTFCHCGGEKHLQFKVCENWRNRSHLIGIKLHQKVFSGNTSNHHSNREVSTPQRLTPVTRVTWISDVSFVCNQEPRSKEAYRKWWRGNIRTGWVEGDVYDFTERSTRRLPTHLLAQECKVLVVELWMTFLVKLGVTGVDPLYPTLLLRCFWGLPSAGRGVYVLRCVLHWRWWGWGVGGFQCGWLGVFMFVLDINMFFIYMCIKSVKLWTYLFLSM